MKRSPLFWLCLPTLSFAACGGGGGGGGGAAVVNRLLSTSGSVQLSANGQYAFVLNKLASPSLGANRGSVTIVRVKNDAGSDVNTVVGEIAVGKDPYSVTKAQNSNRLFVSNAEDNSVTIVDLGPQGEGPFTRLAEILVGAEPRGTAELDDKIYIANYGEGTLSVIVLPMAASAAPWLTTSCQP